MALQWTPLRLTMTGNNVERRRNEIINDVRRRSIHMLDKEVQYEPPTEVMDYEGTDSGISGSGDLAITVVEINNSPTSVYESSPAFTSALPYDNSNGIIETNFTEHEHSNSIIRRDSLEKLREQEESNGTLCPGDDIDCSTLPVSCRINNLLDNAKSDNDSVDEIKEQASLVVMNNCLNNDEKLKELSEQSEESNCALDCLSFTMQCCDCTIL